jgi:hypothetical protein
MGSAFEDADDPELVLGKGDAPVGQGSVSIRIDDQRVAVLRQREFVPSLGDKDGGIRLGSPDGNK